MTLDRISDVLERGSDMNLSRRQFLSASAALGGGLLIGFTAGRSISAAGAAEKVASEPFMPNAFIRIDPKGQVTLITDAGETTMGPGTCVGFKAGVRNAHHFINRSDRVVHYLVVGSRVPGDQSFYPDDDLIWIDTADDSYAAHKDGSRY